MMKLGRFIDGLKRLEEEYGSDAEVHIDYETDFEVESYVIEEYTFLFITTPCYYDKQKWIAYPSDEEIQEMAEEECI